MIRILVVEDDIKLNQIVCAHLSGNGFMARGCLGPNEAYEVMNDRYDLIISDIMMPIIDGFEFAKTVREINQTIPILFMTAKDDMMSKQKGYQAGIDDYMVKPIELDELIFRIRALLRRANIETQKKLVVGNLLLDAEALQNENLTFKQRQEYALTIKESTKRLSELVSNILKLNKIENQKIQMVAQPYNICRQLCDCALHFEAIWKIKILNLQLMLRTVQLF